MRSWRVFLLILIAVGTGCKKDDNPVTTKPGGNTIMPVKVGNSWEGTFAFYDTSGNITSYNDTLVTSLFTIVKDTVIQGEHWFETSGASLPPASFDRSMLLTVRTDGLWGRPPGTGTSVPYLIAKFPCAVNATYSTGTGNNFRASLLSNNSPVSVPRGTYSCYRYQVSDMTVLSDLKCAYYMYPDSGFVRVDQFGKTASGRSYVNTSFFLKRLILN